MCYFHQEQIIRRYITQNPILPENIELKEISEDIWWFSRKFLELLLNDRFSRNKKFLNERNDSGKLVHTRTINAYKSLKSNLKYLYTYKDYEWIIDILATTNSLELTFSRLKTYLRVHRWLNKQRKLKFINAFLSK